ncbi:unnamed protein product [Blumeria hordei]|uniref:Fungal-type protein kinase domain-containing protein n=1 Tax=Blumeria hordei TaxID=2867405 RepID=A0A383V3M9_BLUHO|nr:unnamed protein product [Blumeria hordei]
MSIYPCGFLGREVMDAYSCGEMEVSKSQETLVWVLSSFMLMSEEDLGWDPITSYDENGRCLVTVPNGKTSEEKNEVYPLSIARPEIIASRGNMCLETKDSMYLLSFSWVFGSVESETKILKHTNDVTSVITLNYSSDLCDIDENRKGIKFSEDKKWYINVSDPALSHGIVTRSGVKKPFMERKLTYAKLSPVGQPL